MIHVGIAEYESTSGIGEGQELRDSVPQPLEGVEAEPCPQYQQSEHELETYSPYYCSPSYLHGFSNYIVYIHYVKSIYSTLTFTVNCIYIYIYS